MAFTTTVRSKLRNRDENAYNVDWPVGRGCLNIPEDVMLVQLLFRMFYWELRGTHEFTPPPAEQNALEVDGWVGPVTIRYIVHFQRQWKKRGIVVSLDGTIDPFRGQAQLSTISKTRYTLELLNNSAANGCANASKDYFDILPNSENTPERLRNALQTYKSTAAKYDRR